MPKIFLTSEERRRAEADKKNRRQDSGLVYELREAVKGKYTYEELAQRAGVGKSTVQKAFNKPSEMRVDLLRKICYAAGVQLEISGTIQQ